MLSLLLSLSPLTLFMHTYPYPPTHTHTCEGNRFKNQNRIVVGLEAYNLHAWEVETGMQHGQGHPGFHSESKPSSGDTMRHLLKNKRTEPAIRPEQA